VAPGKRGAQDPDPGRDAHPSDPFKKRIAASMLDDQQRDRALKDLCKGKG
jgi:hypothetical protein